MTLDINERQLRLALENAPFPLLAYDEAGRVHQTNEELLRVTGYRAEQIPTFAAWRELAGRDLSPAEMGDSALYVEGEFPVRIADGSQRLWRFRSFSIGRDEGAQALQVMVAADLTGQRGAALALARSETKLRIGGVGSFERDFLGRVTHYSDELAAMHGLPEARQESFESWFARVHPDDRGRVVAYAEGLGDAHAPHAVEYRISRLPDGGWRRIAERREVQRDAAGRAIGCVGLQRDVTETRAAEQALVDSEARLRMTLEIGQVGTFSWDLPNDNIIWDERVREIWGVAPDAPLSSADFYAGLHPDDLERVRAIHLRGRDSGGTAPTRANIASSTAATAGCAASPRAAGCCSKTAVRSG